MADLSDFIRSKVRVELLEVFFKNAEEMWYVRELTRLVGEEINAVRRELAHLQECGLIKSEERGNRLYYRLNPSYDFYYDLLTLIAKTTGLGQEIKHNRKKLGDVQFVMFSGSFARKKPHKNTDVDILVIGSVVLPELSALVKKEEEERGTEINYTVMTAEEFEFRKTRRDPFLRDLLEGSRIMIIGDEDSFLESKPQLAT